MVNCLFYFYYYSLYIQSIGINPRVMSTGDGEFTPASHPFTPYPGGEGDGG